MSGVLPQDDPYSFLIPCYGFHDPQAAAAYLTTQPCDTRYAPVNMNLSGTHFVYVPHCELSGNYTTALHTQDGCNQCIYEVMRLNNTPLPDGAYHVSLLASGRRIFERTSQSLAHHPSWWKRLIHGGWDCYSAWSRTNGEPLPSALAHNHDQPVTLHALRSGIGVIYTQMHRFNQKGDRCGLYVSCTRVEFASLSSDPHKDDKLRLIIHRCTLYTPDSTATDIKLFQSGQLEPRWQSLVDQAHDGFKNTCYPVPPAIEQWRQFFVDQRRRTHNNQQQPFTNRFQTITNALDWHSALNHVQEAWQLAVMVHHHPDSRFLNAAAVVELVNQYNCSPEKKVQLDTMINDYVSLVDRRWTHSQ